jgi:ABC-type taurine transport system ATPase subunit
MKIFHLSVVRGLQIQPQSVVMGSLISLVDELQRNHMGKLWLPVEQMKEESQFIT